MPVDELCDYVRRRLPVRARMVGAERLDGIVRAAVAEWPTDWLMQCRRGSSDESRAVEDTADRVARAIQASAEKEKQYGFIWALLLSAAISAIVQRMLEWWLSRPANRVKMTAWQQDMRAGG